MPSFYKHTPLYLPTSRTPTTSPMAKTKTIKKQPTNESPLPRRPSQLRDSLRRHLISPRFSNSWLEVLQVHRKETVHKSKSFRQAVRECRDLTCPVCYGLMILPVVLSCGHTFCRPCIEQATLLQDRCCICRAPNSLEHFAVCPKTSQAILSMGLEQLGGEEREEYERKYREYLLWQRMTMISPEFRIGDLVHFYDHDQLALEPQKGWRYGVVTKVTVKRGEDVYLEVQPLIFRKQEKLNSGFTFHYLSSRLARYQFFYDVAAFKSRWQSALRTNPAPRERDQELRETIGRRIADKTIRERGKRGELTIDESLSREKNAIKYFLRDAHFMNLEAVMNYTFTEFQEGKYLVRQEWHQFAFSWFLSSLEDLSHALTRPPHL